MKKILVVIGTRPEAIKMAPLIKSFLENTDHFMTKICITAQHREMLDAVLSFFEIKVDFDLNIMKPNQNLYSLTADIIGGMKSVLEEFSPDYVFVHGDTTTTLAASISAFYFGAKVCHVEAGLRTHNKRTPFPEEMNRNLTGRIADYNFTPTEQSKRNLLIENVSDNSIIVTGNTVIDSLFESLTRIRESENHDIVALKKKISFQKPIVLVTGHRRENFGLGFINICNALKEIAKSSSVDVIYPVHLNPNVQEPVKRILKDVENIHLIEPLSYPAFVWLMSLSTIIITDSGGIQEEAPSLGKPVLVLRDTTERPEAVEAGTVILVGTNQDKIVSEALSLLNDKARYDRMSKLHNPYGDGHASDRIIEFMKKL